MTNQINQKLTKIVESKPFDAISALNSDKDLDGVLVVDSITGEQLAVYPISDLDVKKDCVTIRDSRQRWSCISGKSLKESQKSSCDELLYISDADRNLLNIPLQGTQLELVHFDKTDLEYKGKRSLYLDNVESIEELEEMVQEIKSADESLFLGNSVKLTSILLRPISKKFDRLRFQVLEEILSESEKQAKIAKLKEELALLEETL